MRAPGCAWEQEILRTIAEGRSPEGFEDDLREHPRVCASCADLIEVAVALACDRDAVLRSAPVPFSGAVWWRAQLRMRRDAERSARRTVALVQVGILGACSILALVALVWLAPLPPGWLDHFASGANRAGIPSNGHSLMTGPIVLALAGWLLLILVAIRYALADNTIGAAAHILNGIRRLE
jgi:hypothetical protein